LRIPSPSALVNIMAAMTNPATTQTQSITEGAETPTEEDLVEEDLLVEEISIDGMCGVY
jgi:mycofactocin precursor